jgi:hypothetical protein
LPLGEVNPTSSSITSDSVVSVVSLGVVVRFEDGERLSESSGSVVVMRVSVGDDVGEADSVSPHAESAAAPRTAITRTTRSDMAVTIPPGRDPGSVLGILGSTALRDNLRRPPIPYRYAPVS